MSSKAIYDFIRSVGLRAIPNVNDPLSAIIPKQCYATDDNRLVFTAMYVGDKALANEIIAEYIRLIDEFNNHGDLKIKYSLMDEICGIEEKEWAQKLEDYLPYEQRSSEIFSMIESPLRYRGIKGNACCVSLVTHESYFISVTAFDTQDEVKKEDIEYFLSGQAFQDLIIAKKRD